MPGHAVPGLAAGHPHAVRCRSHCLAGFPALEATEALRLTVWHGLIPATFAMLWGALLRRWLGTRIFVYIFGRGFVGTLLSLFAAGLLSAALGHALPGVHEDLSQIARWLMAWEMP